MADIGKVIISLQKTCELEFCHGDFTAWDDSWQCELAKFYFLI